MFAVREEVKARKRFTGGQEARPRGDLGPRSTKYGAEKHRIWGRNTRNFGPKHARIWGRKIWGPISRCPDSTAQVEHNILYQLYVSLRTKIYIEVKV
jgi:hypothetical protein